MKRYKILSVCLLGSLIGIYSVIPILNDVPQPTGAFSIGTLSEYWSNKFSDDAKYEKFNVELFYPIERSENTQKHPYQLRKIAALKDIFAADSYLPRFIWNLLLRTSYTYAQSEAYIAPARERYPVVFHLPGIGSADLHNVYLEELTSHGYVVCAIEPPHDVMASVFPDGGVVLLDAGLQKAIKENDRVEIYAYRNEAHVRWNSYLDAAIQHMRALNNNHQSMFYQRLDLNKIGFIGHSHGGAVVTDYCQKNKICKAGINMDGWTKTYNTGQRFDTPFLFLLSESGKMPEMQELLDNNQRDSFRKVVISGSGHGAFSDEGILIKWPFSRFFGAPSKNPDTLRKEIAKYIVSFFDTYLKNTQ